MRNKGFDALHPLVLFLYFSLALTLCLVVKNLTIQLVALAVVILCNNQILGRKVFSMLRGKAFLALSIALINPLFNHRGATILFYMGDNAFTWEALQYGLIMGLALMNTLLIFDLWNQVFTGDKLLYLFSSIAEKSIMVLILALSYVPFFKNTAYEISAINRAHAPTEHSLKRRFVEGQHVLDTLVLWALLDSGDTALTMRARGYGVAKRTYYHNYKFRPKDWLFMFYSLCALTLTVAVSQWAVLFILAIPIFAQGDKK